MSLESKIRAVKEALPKIIKDLEKPFLNEILPYFESQFEDRGADFSDKVTSNKLGIRSGQLVKSFYAKANQDGYEVGTDLPYASIHENGGIIKNTQKMEKFFWFKYFESSKRKEQYKFMALAVIRNLSPNGKNKKAGFVIPKRPFFKPAVDDIASNKALIAQQISKEFISKLVRVWNNA